MLHYFIQTIAFQLFFIIVYNVFLKNETFFNWNRVYLLGTTALSFVLPLIQIERFKNVVPQNFIVTLPEVVLGQENVFNSSATEIQNALVESNSLPLWELVCYLGVALALGLFLFKLTNILILIHESPKTKLGKLKLVKLLKSTKAFSFFNYIFLGEHLNEKEKECILSHEIVHVKQNHTLDLLFFEVLRIVFWFNPLVYIYQNKIMALHEFIADDNAVKQQNKSEYYQNLLSQIFDTNQISFINPFFKQSLIKKRIVMLQKSKSKQINLIKYALLIPIVFGMLVYSSCEKHSEEGEIKIESNNSLEKVAPLFMLDEVIISKEELNAIDPDKITSINVIKGDELAIEKYGVLAKNGVVLVSTKDTKEINKENVEVPFGVVDEVPIFPGCEALTTNDERKKCMSEKIAMHVNRNFNTKLADSLNLKGRQRINVIFKIDKEGDITGVRSRAPHPALKAEAIRVIKLLPKMQPGKQNGKKVVVPYSLPIIFQVQDDVPSGKKE